MSDLSRIIAETNSIYSCISENRDGSYGLNSYLKNYDLISDKYFIEINIAKKILNSEIKDFVNLNAEILSRVSGSILQWVINQVSKQNSDLPGKLKDFPNLSFEEANIFVKAIHKNISNPFLSESKLQDEISEWLKDEKKLSGWLAIYFFDAGNTTLSEKHANLWIGSKFDLADLLELVTEFLKREKLKEYVTKILQKIVFLFEKMPPELLKLSQLTFKYEYYSITLQITHKIIIQKLFPEKQDLIDSLYISSLAKLGKDENALEEYEQKFFQKNMDFLFPEILLPVMKRWRKTKLYNHLISKIIIDENTPENIILEKKDFKGKYSETIEKWFELWKNNRNNIMILLNLSDALIKIPKFQFTGEIEKIKTTIKGIWETLSSNIQYKDLSCSHLILFEKDHNSIISMYEKYFSGSTLNHPFVLKAAKEYVNALLWEKKWDTLFNLFSRDDSIFLREVCSYEDYNFFKLMSEVSKEPEKDKFNKWCNDWEEIISLPLEPEKIRFIISQFGIIHNLLLKNGNPICENEYYIDIMLQIVRRGKALGERIIEKSNIQDSEKNDYRKKLLGVSLQGLGKILSDFQLIGDYRLT